MKIAVSELIVRFMERLGIDHIFGMPGALFKSIKHYNVNTESELKDLLPKLDHKNSINLIEIMIDKDTFLNYVSRR
jgi:thiamine pyrophosphate-dependent acetolactate synthase large subunit-like protein